MNSDDSTKRLQVYELPELDICISSVKQPESRKRLVFFGLVVLPFSLKLKNYILYDGKFGENNYDF